MPLSRLICYASGERLPNQEGKSHVPFHHPMAGAKPSAWPQRTVLLCDNCSSCICSWTTGSVDSWIAEEHTASAVCGTPIPPCLRR